MQAGHTSISDAGYMFYVQAGGRGYQATVSVTWQLANGEVIGSTGCAYNHRSDYRCVTTHCYIDVVNTTGDAFVALW